jgi:hypothetical protein
MELIVELWKDYQANDINSSFQESFELRKFICELRWFQGVAMGPA